MRDFAVLEVFTVQEILLELNWLESMLGLNKTALPGKALYNILIGEKSDFSLNSNHQNVETLFFRLFIGNNEKTYSTKETLFSDLS